MPTGPELDVFELGGSQVAELVGPPGTAIASESLGALRRESDLGGHVWFVKARDEALAWIRRTGGPSG